jgi:hypothetical protein
MTVADSLCCAVLLPAIGVLASVLSHPKTAEDQQPDTSDSSSSTGGGDRPLLESEVDVLRALHQVRLIDDALEGTAVTRLPGGTYGFTYSPLNASPLFREKKVHTFEVHKLPDDRVHLIGFVTEEGSQSCSSGEQMDLHVYPEPWEDAFTAVSIPESRIRRSQGPSRSDGNAIVLDLGADSESVQ